MRAPYGFEVPENCQSCKIRNKGFFCQLSNAACSELNSLKSTTIYPAGAVLFLEKQDPRGVFILCAGQVKLSIGSSSGKTLILRIAKPGEVLGLMASLTDTPYEVTAETLHPCQVSFVRREEFQRFIALHPEAYQGIVRQFSTLYGGACKQLRTVALSTSAPEKLARLLLDWSSGSGPSASSQIKMPLTHEEIAEFIGTTRETVTRTFSEFKNKRLVALQGSTLTIANRPALEAVGGF